MTTLQTLPKAISQSQFEHFNEFGYCVVDGLFTPTEIDEIEAFFEDYKNIDSALFDGSKFNEVDPSKRQLRAIHPHRYSEKVKAWGLNPKVMAVLEDLMGREALFVQTMYYFKPPGAKGQGMHQDNFYLMSAPNTCMAAWTAIDPATVENGCLYVVPKSQDKAIYCPEGESEAWMSYGDSHIRPFPREAKPIPVEVPRGSTLFFNGQLIHGSGPNRTKDRCRRTFIGHYVDAVSEEIAKFYHPVLDAKGNVVTRIRSREGGGPCGGSASEVSYH